ncbi:transposase [Pseudomonas chlororaphis]|nr:MULTISPECIES: transposase [Pseudomonas]WJV27614.1 transposase [Pseudomonas chlororaphis]
MSQECGALRLQAQPRRRTCTCLPSDLKGKLVRDDFGEYNASFELDVTEIGCMAHARRKSFERHATAKSQLVE